MPLGRKTNHSAPRSRLAVVNAKTTIVRREPDVEKRISMCLASNKLGLTTFEIVEMSNLSTTTVQNVLKAFVTDRLVTTELIQHYGLGRRVQVYKLVSKTNGEAQ